MKNNKQNKMRNQREEGGDEFRRRARGEAGLPRSQVTRGNEVSVWDRTMASGSNPFTPSAPSEEAGNGVAGRTGGCSPLPKISKLTLENQQLRQTARE